jgi:DNA-binding SARP family transcriptional activator
VFLEALPELQAPRIATATAGPVRQTMLSGVLRLALLEGFELSSEGRAVTLPLSAQRLLAFLALQDRPLLRLYVAGVLWPDTPEERSSANLRSAIWRLHRPGWQLVQASPQHVALAASVRVDIRELTRLARGLLDRSTDCDNPACSQLCASGDLLRDWYDDWVLMERERFRQLRLHALEKLCENLTLRHRFGEAVEAGIAAVAGEPLRESGQRVLVRAYLAEGNHAEARRQYVRYKTLLHSDLGLEPTAEMEALIAGTTA